MQVVVCKFQGCGFRSVSGFCMKRVLCVNEQGVCSYLTKQGWDKEVNPWEKSNWMLPEQEKKAIEESEKEPAAVAEEEDNIKGEE